MPRISAPTIAEHVAEREQAVFDAAIDLFMQRPAAEVSIGDIARDAGLARTSVYRYFPTKASIVHRWFRATIGPLVAAGDAIADTDGDLEHKVERWVGLHLDHLADGRHRAMIRTALGMDDMPADLRADIAAGHDEMYASLRRILREAGLAADAVPVRAALIAGLLRSFLDLVERGGDTALVRGEVTRAALACVRAPVGD